jgi:hypothetical protein
MKTKDFFLNVIAAILLPVYCVSCAWFNSPSTQSELTALAGVASAIAPQYGAPIALGLYGLQAIAAATNTAPSGATVAGTVAAQSGGALSPANVANLAAAITSVVSRSKTPAAGLQAAAAQLITTTDAAL